MDKNSILIALKRLGELGCSGRVVVVGSAAALLEGWLDRTTMDVDVVVADPKLSEFSREIEAVGDEMRLHSDTI